MKKFIFLCQFILGFWLFNQTCYSQDYESGIFRIWLYNSDIRFSDNQSSDNSLNTILEKFGVTSIEQSFPWAKKAENRLFYTVKFTGNDIDFINELRAKAKHLMYPPIRLAIPTLLYEPSDVLWTDTIWHLRKIQADLAWDIERGNKDTKIAIIDTYFDPEHPDLSSQLLYNYDPTQPETVFDSHFAMVFQNWHGTTVAGFAAGQTTDSNLIQPIGADYASIGFNNKIIPFTRNDMLGKALYASTKLHADVISVSAFETCDMADSTKLATASILQEILDNGTVIVMAAGNGFCAGCYKNTLGEISAVGGCKNPGDFVEFTPPYPFSPLLDSRIISVTGVTSGDSLTRRVYDTSTHQYKTSTWSYFDQVDVSSPGYDLWGLQTTLIMIIDTIPMWDTVNHRPWEYYDTTYIKRDHPFWNGYGGTSFATPIVAGLASLLKAHFPWLSAEEVERHIKSNTNPVLDADIYRNPVTHKLRTGNGRINAYQALLDVENLTQNYFICDTNEVIWNDTIYVKDTIRICKGSTLRVKSDVFFRSSARVIVECGGKLIVDGGRLTGPPYNTWTGVLAYSDPKNDPGPLYQSSVHVINGGVIENARTAINTVTSGFDPDSTMISNGGAIVFCDSAIFRNNRIGINFNPYSGYCSSNILKSKFIIDGPLSDDSIPETFINLNGINGLHIKGSTFEDIYRNRVVTGINSYNSGFTLEEYCTGQTYPCTQKIESRFSNLKYGIYVYGTASLKTARVENCSFINNKTGAYISGLYGFQFISNYVSPRSDVTNITETESAGLYLDNSSGYKIESNIFENPYSPITPVGNRIGIIVNNSGPENNFIYLNAFTNLTHGIHAQGENSSRDGSTGLEIKCNDFTDCKTDISVLAEYSGIKYEQGSLGTLPTDAAGNLFSNLTDPGYWSIYNDAMWINYNYHRCDIGSRLRPSKVFQVNRHMGPVEYTSASCPPSSGGEETKDQLVSGINESKLQADSLAGELNLLVDLSNTPLVVNDIITSIPQDSTLVYNELIEISPYVSDTVIFESVKREDVFSNIKIHDLIKLNSHAAKSTKVIDEIDKRQNYMPDSLYYSILSYTDSVSGKEIIEDNISAKLRDASRYFQTYYKRNPNESAFAQEFLDTLSIINLFEAKGLRASIFFNLKMTDSALNEMILLSNSDLVNGYEERCEDLLSFYSVCNQYGFDSIPDTVLLSLYDSTNKLSTAYYRNILINRGLINYQEPYLFPYEIKSSKIRRNRAETVNYSSESCLRIYPNPAKNFLILEYAYPDKIETASIRIMDIFGKVTNSFSMNPKSGKKIINLDNLSPGIYLLESLTSDIKKETVKFTIIK